MDIKPGAQGKNLAGFRKTLISEIKDFGANSVLTQISQQQHGEGMGGAPTLKWGSQEFTQGRESGRRHKEKEFQLQGLYRFF